MTIAMMVENMGLHSKSLGSPGIDILRWLHPVYPRDVISLKMTVLDMPPSKSRPNIRVVTSKVSVSNHKSTVVMEFINRDVFSLNIRGLHG